MTTIVITEPKPASISWHTNEQEPMQINAAVTELITHFSQSTDPDNTHDYMVSLVMAFESMEIAEQYAYEHGDSRVAEWMAEIRESIWDYIASTESAEQFPDLVHALTPVSK